jgi:hypothetical protein
MSLHILIGHSLPGQRGTVTALYAGPSGQDLRTAQNAAPAHIASFTILNNALGIRKRNPAYDPTAQQPTDSSAPQPVAIPEDIAGLKKPELASALTTAIARIKELETSLEAANEKAITQPIQGGNDDQKLDL